jgi:hypothetical protein
VPVKAIDDCVTVEVVVEVAASTISNAGVDNLLGAAVVEATRSTLVLDVEADLGS